MYTRQWYMPAYVTFLIKNNNKKTAESRNCQSFKAEKKPELPTMFGVIPANGFAGERPPSAGQLAKSQRIWRVCGHLILMRSSERV